MAGKVYIGIAGWSYPDWKGIVYTQPACPKYPAIENKLSFDGTAGRPACPEYPMKEKAPPKDGTAGKPKLDQLEYISRYVDCVEINSTFYRPPFEKTTKSWLVRTAEKKDFFFTAKLHRDFTHEGKIDAEMVRYFHKGFQPFLEANKLKQLLAQFRYDFADCPENRQHLSKIVESFADAFNLAVEVRHKSWENPEALDFLRQLGVSVANLDYPTTYNSFNLQHCTVGKTGYFRMHGRNFEKWFSKEAGRDETYNYYYNTDELAGIKSRIDELAEAFEFLTVIANNHYRGAELANAIELKVLLTGQKQPVPEGLLKTYPNLEKIAAN